MNTLVWGMVKLLWHYDFRRNDIATGNEGGNIIFAITTQFESLNVTIKYLRFIPSKFNNPIT
jgi:hypothetical protein